MKIYGISGLGADERVFNYLTLDQELVPIEWITPKKKESIVSYAKRLIKKYGIGEEPNFGILGVSFGGLIATEISKITNPKFTILISSIETRRELSVILKIVGRTQLISFVPKKLLNPPKAIAYYMFGTDQKELLASILDETDLNFTKWALRELLHWKNQTTVPNLIKIGGSKDKLLPPKGENTLVIKNGAHFMIVDKAEEISLLINDEIKKILRQNQ
ncbi:alpha/beta hydrolase [Cellulophaga sp. E16_2]|uniref:alpha/beta hydrolase n=1 Tax=Cellulophaga sp. E16_2 TaxID=2789297 RepID=UPI001A935863|nr:alpha/beta hydrolase [Cellulophaga sp. E16_2]MBO0593248.1 alpha/beta hydrolase [Cellulophaga sp. E16_2]